MIYVIVILIVAFTYFFCIVVKILKRKKKLLKKKENGKFKTWEQITHEFKIDKNLHFKWIQLVPEGRHKK